MQSRCCTPTPGIPYSQICRHSLRRRALPGGSRTSGNGPKGARRQNYSASSQLRPGNPLTAPAHRAVSRCRSAGGDRWRRVLRRFPMACYRMTTATRGWLPAGDFRDGQGCGRQAVGSPRISSATLGDPPRIGVLRHRGPERSVHAVDPQGTMMVRKVQSVSGGTGYRHQLDRARRFLDRVNTHFDDLDDLNDTEFQDMMWSFFQHCWHLKDWVLHDPLASDAQKAAVSDMAHQSSVLMMCRDLCNGTKHLKLNHPGSGTGAKHQRIEMTIVPEQGRFEMDCMVDDGHGNLISGKQLACDCIAEWERILTAQGLVTARQS
jgi:hypothetical protein